MKNGICLFMVVYLAFCMGSPVAAQEEDDYVFVNGEVVAVTSDTIVIIEEDETSDEQVEKSYMIDEDTVWEDFENIEDIPVGEKVDLFYVEENGNRIARYIVKEFSVDEEDGEGENRWDEPDEYIEEILPEMMEEESADATRG